LVAFPGRAKYNPDLGYPVEKREQFFTRMGFMALKKQQGVVK